MPVIIRIVISVIIIILPAITGYTITFAASIPSGTGNNTNSFGNLASSTNSPSNILSNQNKKAPAPDNVEQKEPNPKLYENYQQCYASLISDGVGRPHQEIESRKVTIKKYCKAISNAKYQKKFSDCFNTNINNGNDLDFIINECVSGNEMPVK